MICDCNKQEYIDLDEISSNASLETAGIILGIILLLCFMEYVSRILARMKK